MVHRLNDPTEKDGQYTVECTCGYVTPPSGSAVGAWRVAIMHVQDASTAPRSDAR